MESRENRLRCLEAGQWEKEQKGGQRQRTLEKQKKQNWHKIDHEEIFSPFINIIQNYQYRKLMFYLKYWLRILVIVGLLNRIFLVISLEIYRDLCDLADCLYGRQRCGYVHRLSQLAELNPSTISQLTTSWLGDIDSWLNHSVCISSLKLELIIVLTS